MGDAADDMFDAELRLAQEAEAMFAAGCRPCPRLEQHEHDEGECPVCLNMNWLDKKDEPCEP